jgi:hypothetical protein
MSSVPTVDRYPDPLRKGGEQAIISTCLFCAHCLADLSHGNGIADIRTGHAFCTPEHWTAFFERKGKKR